MQGVRWQQQQLVLCASHSPFLTYYQRKNIFIPRNILAIAGVIFGEGIKSRLAGEG